MKKAITIAMVVFLLSVPSFAATVQPQRGGTLRILTNVVPTNFGNPKLVAGGKAPIFPCMEQLINLDAEGNVIPLLATSWDTDPGNKTITYHLKKGVKFHDGRIQRGRSEMEPGATFGEQANKRWRIYWCEIP